MSFTYELEFSGGLGDVFYQIYQNGCYNLLRDLAPDETAHVTLICHNPFAHELFTLHPKASQLTVRLLEYWQPWQDAAKREEHGLGPPHNDAYPKKDRFLEFRHTLDDEGFLQQLRNRPYLVIAPSAGLYDKILPKQIRLDIAEKLLSLTDFYLVFVGRTYDRIDELGRNRHETDIPMLSESRLISAVDKLSVPGLANLIARSQGVVTAHSACSMIGWMMEKPQLVVWPDYLAEWLDPQPRTPWALGFDWHRTLQCRFSIWQRQEVDQFIKLLPTSRSRFEHQCQIGSNVTFLGGSTQLSTILGDRYVYSSTEDDTIAPHLAMSGFWESWISVAIMNFLEPGMVVADVGACFGYYSLLMHKCVGPTGQVHIFEPDSVSFRLLQRTTLLNGMNQANLYNLAAGSCSGTRQFFSNKRLRANSTLFGGYSHFEGRPVKVVPLDTILAHLHRLDFIKIDVEGAEEEVWEGFRELREKHHPTIAIEYNPDRYADAGKFYNRFCEYTTPHIINVAGQIERAQRDEVLASKQDVMLWLPSPLPKSQRL